jgi:diguanylate cyclase (GGDEF)-like protein
MSEKPTPADIPEAVPAGADDHRALLAALRRAAVINAALLKLRGNGEAAPAAFLDAVDEAIHLLDGARTAGEVRAIEERLVAVAFETAHQPAPEPLPAIDEQTPPLTAALARLRQENERFADHVLDRSERMQFLAAHADVDALRTQLRDELEALRRATLAKKEADAVQLPVLEQHAATLEERVHVFAAHSRFDPITGLYNRAAWDEQLTRIEASGFGRPAIAVIEIDAFAEFAEQSGRLATDAVLAAFGAYCKKAFGDEDFVARIGGGQFGALIAAPYRDHAIAHIERLLDYIRRSSATPHLTPHPPFSVSAGLAFAQRDEGVHAQLARAAAALQGARRGGRGRLPAA